MCFRFLFCFFCFFFVVVVFFFCFFFLGGGVILIYSVQVNTFAGVANAVVFVLDRPTVDAINYHTIKVSA